MILHIKQRQTSVEAVSLAKKFSFDKDFIALNFDVSNFDVCPTGHNIMLKMIGH